MCVNLLCRRDVGSALLAVKTYLFKYIWVRTLSGVSVLGLSCTMIVFCCIVGYYGSQFSDMYCTYDYFRSLHVKCMTSYQYVRYCICSVTYWRHYLTSRVFLDYLFAPYIKNVEEQQCQCWWGLLILVWRTDSQFCGFDHVTMCITEYNASC